MSFASRLVGGMIPGVNREPLKKIAADPEVPLRLLYCWRNEGIKAGKEITRIAVAHETFGWPVGRGIAALKAM
jgi:transposase